MRTDDLRPSSNVEDDREAQHFPSSDMMQWRSPV
jgi:hypothetical protein